MPGYDPGDTVNLLLGHGPQADVLRRLGLHDAMAAGLRSQLARPIGASAAEVGVRRSSYNPNEPRDDHGRWTTDGSGDSSASGGGRTRGYGLYGGRFIRIQIEPEGPGIGDNSLEQGRLPEGDKARPGFEPSGSASGGLSYPDHPPLDGKPWPTVSHDMIKATLAPQGRATPTMVVYVPQNGHGLLLVGSDRGADFPPPPPGYDSVTLKGTPQVTYSGGTETGHAYDSIDEAMRLAASNQFSTIYFNRSFTTVTEGMVESTIRPDVVAVARPDSGIPPYHPYESYSPGQDPEDRKAQMPPVPWVARLRGNSYNNR